MTPKLMTLKANQARAEVAALTLRLQQSWDDPQAVRQLLERIYTRQMHIRVLERLAQRHT